VALPPAIKPGKVDVDVGIVDGETLQPVGRFANRGNDPDGWRHVLSIDVIGT